MTRPGATIAIGERFGRLVVTEIGLRLPPTPSQAKLHRQGVRAARTLCDCGAERIADASKLLTGRLVKCSINCAIVTPATTVVSTDQILANTGNTPVGAIGSRGGRKAAHIDTTKFEPLMAEALKVYAVDWEIMTRVAAAGHRVLLKRRQWEARLALREAEAAAREACAASDLALCEVQSPCGVGACHWSLPAFAHLTDVPAVADGLSSKNRSERPKPRCGPGLIYTIESAVPVVLAEQEART